MAEVEKGKVNIKDNQMYYEKRGCGDCVVLLIPGAMGTGALHYSHQHSEFDLKKFTLISVDLIGMGQSRPGNRNWNRHYWFDAECCHVLMNELGIEKYSILGFSDGGRVALIMGAKYPEEILKIVAVSCGCYVTEEEKRVLNATRKINTWNSDTRKELEEIYGDELEPLWNEFLDAYTSYNDIFKSEIPKIKCPVFILHGEYDNIVFVEHAHYFRLHIKNVRLYIESKGPHYFHLKNHSTFNKMVQEWLLEKL